MSSCQSSCLRKNRKSAFNISMGMFSIIQSCVFFFVISYRHLSLNCSHCAISWNVQVWYCESTLHGAAIWRASREMPWILLYQAKQPRDKYNKAVHGNPWFLVCAMRHTYIIQAESWVNGCKQKVNVQRGEKDCKLQGKGGILYGRE